MNLIALGVPVALLQEDGRFSNNSYLIRKDLSRPLREFSLCARLSLNYLRGETNYWLSIGNATKDNLLIGGNKITVVIIYFAGILIMLKHPPNCFAFQFLIMVKKVLD